MAARYETKTIVNDARREVATPGNFDKAYQWLKEKARGAVNFSNIRNSQGQHAIGATVGEIGVAGILAALGKIPLAGSVIKTAVGLIGLEGRVDKALASRIEEAAVERMKAHGYITAEDLGVQYLALAFKGIANGQMKDIMNALEDLREMTPKVQEAMESLSQGTDLSCSTFLNAFKVYHAYRQTYWRARTALDWFYAWHLQTEEVLEPLGASLKVTEEQLEKACDDFFKMHPDSRDRRAYHNEHCKHTEGNMFFGYDRVGYCQGCR